MPARSIDTASIVFGLVAIPIKVFSTSEPSHEIHFHMVHAGCGERLRQESVCPAHGKVDRAAIAKGYEVTKGTMIELANAELAALDAVANDEIAIREFVPASAVDPILIERSYYLAPDKGGNRAYRLLRDALNAANLVGIAAYAARGKAYVVMLRPFEDGLAMHQLRYPDEIKAWREVPLGQLPKPTSAELDLATKLVAQLQHTTFDPGAYTDEIKVRVRELLAAKAKSGKTIVAPEVQQEPQLPDLMTALRASLGSSLPAATHHKAAPKRATTRSIRRAPSRAHPPAKRARKSPGHAKPAGATRRRPA